MHDPLKAARVFWIFFKLGLTSFGGPIAHIGFFRNEFVTRRAWLSDAIFAELLTICQFLPGPSSSQLGFAIGLMRAGWLGALAAFVGFTLPSALALYGFALVVVRFDVPIWLGALAGLKLVAVAVVAQAVWGMAQTLCPDFKRDSIGVAAFLAVAFFSTAFGMIATISMAAALGFFLLGQEKTVEISTFHCPVIKRHAWGALGLFVLLIAFLPLVAQGDPMLELFLTFSSAQGLWSLVEAMQFCLFCKLKWCLKGLCRTAHFWPVIVVHKWCQGRYLPFLPIWARWFLGPLHHSWGRLWRFPQFFCLDF